MSGEYLFVLSSWHSFVKLKFNNDTVTELEVF